MLLTHSSDKSVSKEEFCQRVAWCVEHVIDEIEHPRAHGEIRRADEIARRIIQRIESRTENDWEECPEFFAGSTRR